MPGRFIAVIWPLACADTPLASTTYCGEVGCCRRLRIASGVMPSGPASDVGDVLPLGHRDQRRVGGHRVGGHGHRQHLPVGAGDAAAQRGQRDGLVPLLQRQLAVITGLHALQLDEAAGEQRQHEDDREQGDAQPPARVAAGGLAAGSRGPSGPWGRPEPAAARGPGRGPFPGHYGRTGRAGSFLGPGPADLGPRPAPRVRAGRSGPVPRTWPGGIAARLRPGKPGSRRPPVIPAVGLRPAGRVLRRHGLYPGTLIAASALDGLPVTIFPVFRSMKPR